jgi:hypothetical protein
MKRCCRVPQARKVWNDRCHLREKIDCRDRHKRRGGVIYESRPIRTVFKRKPARRRPRGSTTSGATQRGAVTCRRCGGLLAWEPKAEIDYDLPCRTGGWQCLNCGDVITDSSFHATRGFAAPSPLPRRHQLWIGPTSQFALPLLSALTLPGPCFLAHTSDTTNTSRL